AITQRHSEVTSLLHDGAVVIQAQQTIPVDRGGFSSAARLPLARGAACKSEHAAVHDLMTINVNQKPMCSNDTDTLALWRAGGCSHQMHSKRSIRPVRTGFSDRRRSAARQRCRGRIATDHSPSSLLRIT